MKNIIALSLLTSTLLLNSCKKLDEFTQFELSYTETVVVPNNNGILNLPFNLETEETETNTESEFKENDTDKEHIEEIKLKSMTLSLESPTSADFSFLESIRIYINANGLGEKEIAWKTDIQDNEGNTLTLDTSNDDLNSYIQKDAFKLRVNTVTDEVLNQDHVIKVSTVFSVDAEVVGI